jgi:polysaccharide export outer membrane protein
MKVLFAQWLSVVQLSGALFTPMQQGGGAVAPAGNTGAPAATVSVAPAPLVIPPNYVIGPEDILVVAFWRDKEPSSEVVVRPDGKISLPLLNDVQAAGLTPEELRQTVLKAAVKFVAEPNATVVVKAINSRKVFVSGMIARPGAYPMFGDKTVAQLIAEAGGLQEYADSKKIVIHREDGGKVQRFIFNYKDFEKGKGLDKNIILKPGDLIIVP